MKLIILSLALALCVTAFEVSISTKDATTVGYAITNPSDAPVQVLKWGTPFEGIRSDMFLVKSKSGDVAMYTGAIYRRGPYPLPEEFLVVPEHSTINIEVDLSLSYQLGKVGEYTVDLQIPSYAQVVPSEVTRSKTTIRVTEVKPPKPSVDILRDYQNCNSNQQTQVRSAVNQGKQEAARGYNCLRSGTCNSQATTWLGVNSGSRWNNVRDMCNRIDGSLNANSFNCYCMPAGCGSNVYAYVYPSDSSRRVYLCNLFFTLPNERAETIVHEMSHFNSIGGTNDYVYGRSACQNLARTNPTNAVRNADNICYFTDAV